MSLSNPNKPVTEERLQEFYHRIAPYMGNEGGGTGGGHTIEDSEGTELTQRDTLQFSDGLNVSDDSTNGKTVVEPNLMVASDMDDVVTPLPSVQSRYHKYSTEEQIVGEWIDGKPIYEKVIVITSNLTTAFEVASDLEIMVNVRAIRINPNACSLFPYVPNNTSNYNNYVVSGYYERSNGKWYPQLGSSVATSSDSYRWIFQYTKTTDTSNT